MVDDWGWTGCPPSKSHAAVDLGTVKDGDGVPVAEAVAGVADVEEGLVVVRGQLGQPRHQLLHLGHAHLHTSLNR